MAQYLPVLDLSDLDGTNGFKINGEALSGRTGYSVSAAGDVNGDGIDDLIVGAFLANANGSFSGAAYVVFGSTSPFAATFELSALDGTNGFRMPGEAANDRLGTSVSAGDINGDGLGDVIVGADSEDPNGAVYVVFGTDAGFDADIDLSTLDGGNGFKIAGLAAGDQLGQAVSAGDVNGDGFDDLILGALHVGDTDRGATYVVFGKASGFAANVNLGKLNGTTGFTINGASAGDLSGRSVSNAGDVNGDGFDDIAIGAYGVGPDTSYTGASYVVFGHAGPFAKSLKLSALDGTNGFKISAKAGDQMGFAVSTAGDINADGIDDLIVGAFGPNSYAGASFVVFGRSTGFGAVVDPHVLDGSDGFRISGEAADDLSGRAVSAAGDVNGDGFGDLIIGAYGADPGGFQSGAAYVVFGKAGGFSANLNLSSLNGDNGFQISGEDTLYNTAQAVSAAGDINGDGFDDILIGAPIAAPNGTQSGASYVVYGGPPATDVVRTGTGIANTIHGGDGDDTLSGLSGDDTLVALGGDDTSYGGSGADSLQGGDGTDSLYGGSGGDTLSGDGGNDALEGGSGNDTLTGGAGGDRLLGGEGKDTLTGGADSDVFAYGFVSESTGSTYDVVKSADFAADVWDLPGAVTGIDATIGTGDLDSSQFNADLAAAVDAAHLAARHAVLFTPNTGTLSGKTFMVVDLNGVAGYQANADLVVQLVTPSHLGSLDTGGFI